MRTSSNDLLSKTKTTDTEFRCEFLEFLRRPPQTHFFQIKKHANIANELFINQNVLMFKV